GEHFAFAEDFKSFAWNVRDKVSKMIDPHHVAGDLFARGFHLAVDKPFVFCSQCSDFFRVFPAGKSGGDGGEDMLLGKSGFLVNRDLPDTLRVLIAHKAEQSVIHANEEVIFNLNDDGIVAAAAGGVDADEMDGAFREVAENSTQYKGGMGEIEMADLMADVD